MLHTVICSSSICIKQHLPLLSNLTPGPCFQKPRPGPHTLLGPWQQRIWPPFRRSSWSTTQPLCVSVVISNRSSLQQVLHHNVYNTHSFRIRRATQLAQDNHSSETIRSAGRWKSSAYIGYIRSSNINLPPDCPHRLISDS